MITNEFGVGDCVIMRKPHACGVARWQITRTGADVKIKCNGCGRIVMMDRAEFMRAAKRIEKAKMEDTFNEPNEKKE